MVGLLNLTLDLLGLLYLNTGALVTNISPLPCTMENVVESIFYHALGESFHPTKLYANTADDDDDCRDGVTMPFIYNEGEE